MKSPSPAVEAILTQSTQTKKPVPAQDSNLEAAADIWQRMVNRIESGL
jgi:hypothetical protein